VKLLVVDDETASRDSLVRNIKKMDFYISFIEQADDGLRALDIAAWFCPDIVLTDVRMPRMDGIEMSFELRKINPDVKIIFLSGYSDKEYLKSAIQLRALSYVEKPVDYEELRKALTEAIHLMEIEKKGRESADIHERFIKNLPLIKNEIAIKMTNSFTISKEPFDYSLLGLYPDFDYVTILIQIMNKDSITSFGLFILLENTIKCVNQVLERRGLTGIATLKDNQYILYHIACPSDKRQLLGREYLTEYLSDIPKVLENIHFFIAVGRQVSGIRNVPESYNTAVVALQKCFFSGYESILFYTEGAEKTFAFSEDIIKEFKQFVIQEDDNKTVASVRSLASEMLKHRNTHVNNIKEFYYRILLQLFDLSDELNLEVFNEQNDRNQLWQTLSNFYTLAEVEEFCIEKIQFFFHCRTEKRNNKGKILQIKNFITINYMNNDLSVKMISEHTFLSLAYMCSIFKLETGKTINQYITDYRIEKAKELLKNKSYNISDVAENVGFNDSQYFAKIFKKKLNLTPTEYKERYQG